MTISKSLILLTLLFSPTLFANDIWGDDGDFMEDDSNAKVQRYTAKQRALEAAMTPEEREQARKNREDCGSVDVGNVQGGGRNVDNVVVIKGDVINVNNRCKATR